MSYTVIGHFSCGCGHAAQPEPLEIVFCSTHEELQSVVGLMKIHSAGHQCHPEPAMAIATSEGAAQVLLDDGKEWGCLLFDDANDYAAKHAERAAKHKRWARLREQPPRATQ